jgi:hypothetical protein
VPSVRKSTGRTRSGRRQHATTPIFFFASYDDVCYELELRFAVEQPSERVQVLQSDPFLF